MSSINNDNLSIKGPVLVVGIGGAAGRLARQAAAQTGSECLLISNDKRDLYDSHRSIYVNTGAWLNPQVPKIRAFLAAKAEQLRSALEGFNTVILIANLAGRSGAAMAPLVCNLASERQGTAVISFAIMPFGFEKNRLFDAGVALRRVRSLSHSTVILDNDAFLDNNPGLAKEECHALTNSAILQVIAGIASGRSSASGGTSILATSVALQDSEESLRDSVSMLYRGMAGSDPVRRAVVYVTGGEKLPVGALNQLASHASGIFKDEGTTEVAIISSPSPSAAAAATDNGSGTRVHLVASATAKTRFDSYDPLGEVIPAESHLDWDEPDSAPEIELAIPLVLRE